MSDAGFKYFLSAWNRSQGQDTPLIHFRMADWLEKSWRNEDKRLLLMAFRSAGKSTILGMFAAWLLYRWPDLRILVLAADEMLAGKMVRNVKRIIERHPLTGGLKPEKLDQWGADRFTVNRTLELRDPSMLARGVGSNITGSRADIIICDDVEVPNTCDTPMRRAELRDRLAEIDFVQTPEGVQLYAGTPHSWFTIYAEEAREEIGEAAPFLAGFKRFALPVLTNGKSAWPERYSLETIESMKRQTGPNRFASQMMLQPVNIAEGRLDASQLMRYSGELLMSDEMKGLYLGGTRMVSASAWWDPSFGHNGDASVVAVIFSDADGMRYLHRMLYIQGPFRDDEATAQCAMVAGLAHDLHLPYVAVETNGIGGFLPNLLRKAIGRLGARCAVRSVHNSVAKDRRIIEAFDVVLAARLLKVHESVYRTPFMTEMQEWRPGGGGHDDGLDAVAGAMSQDPVRIGGGVPGGGQSWTGAGRTHMADVGFEV